jgi:hypothetical protein
VKILVGSNVVSFVVDTNLFRRVLSSWLYRTEHWINEYYLQHEQRRVISDVQTRAEVDGKSLYIRYNADANVVNGLWNVFMRTFVFFSNLK